MTASSFRNSRIMTIILGIAACLVVSYIVLYPDQILQSSLTGLSIWWKIVFPALLPFLIMIEMMTALGVIHFIGALLDPLMRRLFGLPGIAGWCLAIGWTAGAPSSAGYIAELRRSGTFTRQQAERLLAFSHTGSPVLLVIVIAAGFLGEPQLGIPLLIVHWLGALIVAFATGKRHDPELIETHSASAVANNSIADDNYTASKHTKGHHAYQPLKSRGLIASGLSAMEEARLADNRSFGKLLGDSVFDSIQKLMVIGGYMIFFAVLLKVAVLSGFGSMIMNAAGSLLAAAGLPSGISSALFNGVFELHLGAYSIREASLHADVWTMAAVSAVLGWSGFCLHAQVKAAMSGTDVRYYPFMLSRLLHAAAAAVLMMICYPLLMRIQSVIPGFRFPDGAVPVWTGEQTAAVPYPDWLGVLKFDTALIVITLVWLLALMAVSAAMHKLDRHSL